MTAEVLFHLFIVVALPGGRDRLLARVGPPVTVVEVNHHIHAERLSPQGHRQQLVLVARSITCGLHPDTQADGRHLVVILEQLQTLALMAVSVVKDHAALLLTGQAAHVGTLHETCLRSRSDK